MNIKKLFIIDTMAMVFRSYHAMGPRLSNSKGLPTSALYGSAMFLLKLIEDEKPDYMVLASDCQEKTFRHEIYSDYKGNRSEMPDDLKPQMPVLYRMFDAFGFQTLKKPGFEADDIIGTLVHKFAAENLHCYIVSGDKDFMQLINPHVTLYSPKKGAAALHINAKEVQDKFHCSPKQVVDVLALMGDSSDHVPGVFGIGEKGAIKLISTYHSLDGVYEHIDQIANPKLKEALLRDREQAFLSRQLVKIHTEMTLPNALEDFHCDTQNIWKRPELLRVFEELEFRALSEKIKLHLNKSQAPTATAPTQQSKGSVTSTGMLNWSVSESPSEGEAQTPPEWVMSEKNHYLLCHHQQAFRKLKDALNNCEEFAFDSETTGLNIISDQPIGLSFAVKKTASKKSTEAPKIEAFYLPLVRKHLQFDMQIDEIKTYLQQIFSDPSKLKIAHNLKFDLQMLTHLDIRPQGPFGDTMLASFLLNPTTAHGIDPLSLKYLGIKKIPTDALIGKKAAASMLDVELNLLSYYACEDAECCLLLYHKLMPELQNQHLLSLYQEMEIPIAVILAEMEKNGVFVDTQALEELSDILTLREKELEKIIFNLAGEEFNINSPKQLQVILFEKLKVHEALGKTKLKKTKTGFSTDVSVLETLADHPLVAELLDFRTVSKIKNTYTDTLPTMINPRTHRIHTSFHQTGTATGRLSSSNPNLQNIPVRSEIGKKIRKAFMAEPGHVLISADYSQIELRLLAHLAQDHTLIQAFLSGQDIHTATAAIILGKELKDISSDERSQAKAINYGIIYGMGPLRLAKITGVSMVEAKDFIDKYFKSFGQIRAYLDSLVETASERGYSETIKGRKRPIEGLQSRNSLEANTARNIAVNSPIQGSAADLIKIAMIRIQQSLQEHSLKTKLLLQVHDELLFEAPKGEVEQVLPLIRDAMENALNLSVPLVTDIGFGENWLSAHNK